MKHIALPDGTEIPAIGLGTWHTGESPSSHDAEVDAVHAALAMGYRLVDTAEMYGSGGAEEVLGEALRRAVDEGTVTREELFVVSKVYPHNAGRRKAVDACERSLDRLGLDHLDLYLLHWRGSVPLRETVEVFEELRGRGRVRHWGVSNFDTDDLAELAGISGACAVNQVWYSLGERGTEFSLQPAMRAAGIPLMAYSPIDQAALATDGTLARLAGPLGLTAAQLALAWVIRSGDVVAIPKAVGRDHQRENLAAADVELDGGTLAALDAAFPPPRRSERLAIL